MSAIEQTGVPATAGGNGKGRPSDFTSAFADAVVAAVRENEGSRGQAHVATALGLGWYLAALAHPGDVIVTAAAARGELSGPGGTGDVRALAFCRQHVEVAFAKLREVIAEAGPDPAALDELRECIASAEAAARRKAATELDGKLLAVLSAVDFRLSKAYAVGRALMNLTSRPAAGEKLADHLTAAAVAQVVADIDDLTSALPAHAGHSVRDSLLEWRASIRTESRVAPEAPDTWLALARQGELWRAMLAGEKAGRDMLEIEDYLDAAERLSKRMRKLAVRVVTRFPALVAGLLVLIAAGVALIVLTDTEAGVIAGAGSILAGFGLTWRGVGRSLGGAAGKLEQPLWGAELDKAITQAITLLPREQGRDVTKRRRDVAVALRRDEHPSN
jgi:hypothetical protein